MRQCLQDFFPLHATILRREHAAVQAALRKGVAFSKQDAHGNPPLHCAVATGDPALVKLLIDGGANVDLRNLAGNTPLESAFALVRTSNDTCTSVRNQCAGPMRGT